MDHTEAPSSHRWIWITIVVVVFLGLFSWFYLRDDELSPDDDLIRERTSFTEEENGYALVMELSDEVGFSGSDGEWLRGFKYGFSSWDGERARQMLEGQDMAREVLRMLTEKRVIARPAPGTFDYHGSDLIERVSFLGSLNFLSICLAADVGDRSRVIDGLRTGRRLAAQLEAGNRSPSELLLGVGLRMDVFRAIEPMAVSKLFGDSECRTEALAALDGWDMETLWRDSMLSEYCSFKDMLRVMKADGRIGRWVSCQDSWALPSFRLKVNRTSNLAAIDVRETLSVQAETWQEWKSRIPGVRKTTSLRAYVTPNGTGEVVLAVCSPANSGVLRSMLQLKTRKEMSRCLLALRDYHEQNGRLPAELAELVPDFLEAVPTDWMDGKAIRYDAGRGLLWSVGGNLTDDGGLPDSSRDDSVRIPWVVAPGK